MKNNGVVERGKNSDYEGKRRTKEHRSRIEKKIGRINKIEEGKCKKAQNIIQIKTKIMKYNKSKYIG